MKIAFTSDENKGLESVMSYHFGHSPYFVIVEIENNEIKKVETIENTLAEFHGPGELPAFMKNKGVNIIATGGMGPRAQEFFREYGIKPIIGVYGKVKDVLSEITEGKVMTGPQNNVEMDHIHKENENEEIRRLKLEVQELRREVAELKSLIKEIKRGQ